MRFRAPPLYETTISRPDTILTQHSIPANSTKKILSKNDRHSLTIINNSSFTIMFGNKANNTIIPLQPNSSVYFQPRYIAIARTKDDELIFVTHCEWQDDLYVRNPNTITSANIITYEVI